VFGKPEGINQDLEATDSLTSVPPVVEISPLNFFSCTLQEPCHRAAFQGGRIWDHCLEPHQNVPNPEMRGWRTVASSSTASVWTTIPPIRDE